MSDLAALIAAALAAPKAWVVVTTYVDGSTKCHETATASQTENWAIGERRKVGRDLISRETGKIVRVAGVEIVKIGGLQ